MHHDSAYDTSHCSKERRSHVWFLQGYAFVVFADTLVVPRAIEELDCKVVEGKILVRLVIQLR